MRYVGVDGCPDGWLAVVYEGDDYARAAHYEDIADLWDDTVGAETVLVDVPIGLRGDSAAKRRCDDEARSRLSPTRHASVFPTPIRDAVHAESYEAAKRVQEEQTGGSLNRQTWGIAGKIAEVDDLLESETDARGVLREAHPEVCFWALNDQRPTAHSKTAEPLAAFWERVGLLERADEEILRDVRDAGMDVVCEASNDDLLDAFALAVTASELTGDLRTLPDAPERDARGLPMEMAYAYVD